MAFRHSGLFRHGVSRNTPRGAGKLSRFRIGTNNVSIAPVSATAATAHNATVNEPVCVFKYANKYGDTKEEMFPMVLIIPTAAAAAD